MNYLKYILFFLFFLTQNQAQALSTSTTDLKPTTNCVRSYVYRDRIYAVDSNRKLDGEGLRKVLKQNPESEMLLNQYQKNLKISKITAFTGTLGLATFIGGSIYTTQTQNAVAKKDIRKISLYGGLSVLGISYLVGKWNFYNNEKTLKKAVEKYNESVDNEYKIQVNFTPTSTYDGGQIQTIVPF
jgi:hypothetical protein